MKPLVLAIFVFALFSCKTGELSENSDYFYIVKKDYGGNETKSYSIIQNYNDLMKNTEGLHLSEEEKNAFRAINFKKSAILIAYMGQKNTGGYSIGITKMYYDDTKILHIELSETKPEKGKNVTMALTAPYFIASIPKTDEIVIE